MSIAAARWNNGGPSPSLTPKCRHCEERSDEAIQQAAPPNWIASLALAMTTQNLVLATHARPSLPNKSHGSFRLQKNEGRRSADRRKGKVSAPRKTDVATRLRHGRGSAPQIVRLRAPSAAGALASRRSAAALARFYPDATSGQVSWDAARGGVTRRAPVPVQRKHPAHRP